MRDHRELARGGARPLGRGAVPVELDAVAIRVAEVERLADAVVGGAFERDARADETAECVGQLGASGVDDREVVETGGSGTGRRATLALPGVEADVVMVAAGGEKCGAGADALGDLEAEDIAVEGEGAIEVGHLEMDVADARFRMNGRHGDWIQQGAERCPRH